MELSKTQESVSRVYALAVTSETCAEQLRAMLAWKPREYREIRVLGKGEPRNAVVSTPEEAAAAIKGVPYGAGCYITINPISPNAAVVAKTGKSLSTAERGMGASNPDIARRVRFVIDLDPVRTKGTSATEAQLADTRALAASISSTLHAEGWPRPTYVRSGNGVHLYFSIDLPGESDLPARALQALDERFSTDTVEVDTTVGNSSRVMRMPGTWTTKDDVTELHRSCSLEEIGEDRLLTTELLEALVAAYPVSTPAPAQQPSTIGSFDVDGWLEKHGVKHRGREKWPGGGDGAFRWVLDHCPFNPAHNRGEAVITQRANGAVGFICQHNSCSDHGWKELRRVIEAASKARSEITIMGQRMPYPVDALPRLLRDAVRAQVEALSVDEAAVAVPLLTASLGVIGNSVIVEVWTGWTEPMVAWTALIAPSGQMKSATLGLSEKLLIDLERGFPPPLPDEARERLIVKDTTVEALGDVASRNPRGLVLFRDELSAFFASIGQYKKDASADEAFWLSAYEGKYHAIDRRSTGTTAVPQLLVSVIGGIQPSLMRDALKSNRRSESGFAARLWLVWPPKRLISISPPPEELLRAINSIQTTLRLCMEAFRRIPLQDSKPTVLRMSLDAAKRLQQFAQQQEEIAFGLHDSSVERACRQKSRGWAAKLAGLVALFRAYEAVGPRPDGDPTTPDWANLIIEDSDVEAAIRLVEWQLAENIRAHHFLQLDDIDLMLEHHDLLARQAFDPATGCTTVREFHRKHGVSPSEAEKILDGLVKAKMWGSRHPKPGPQGGRPTVEYFPLADSSLR